MRLRTDLPSPQQPDLRGTHEGRPYLVWLPATAPPWPGIVILHGAGSAKENHGDFARLCAASGWASLAYDQRGHGEAKDAMSGAAVDDVTRMARFLGAIEGVDSSRIGARGSSMGGFFAIHAAAVSDAIAGVIAICPAGEANLLRGLRNDDMGMRLDRNAFVAWLGEHDVREATELLGEKPLIVLHARGDERIPFAFSEEIHARARGPRKLILLPGGHHRSVQHDAELQAIALTWLERALERDRS